MMINSNTSSKIAGILTVFLSLFLFFGLTSGQKGFAGDDGDMPEEFQVDDPKRKKIIGKENIGLFRKLYKVDDPLIAEGQLGLQVNDTEINLLQGKGAFNDEIGPHGLIKVGQQPIRPFYKSIMGEIKVGFYGGYEYNFIFPQPASPVGTPIATFPPVGSIFVTYGPNVSLQGGLGLSWEKPHVYPWMKFSFGLHSKVLVGIPDHGTDVEYGAIIKGSGMNKKLGPDKLEQTKTKIGETNAKMKEVAQSMKDLASSPMSAFGGSGDSGGGGDNTSTMQGIKDFINNLKNKSRFFVANAGIKIAAEASYEIDRTKLTFDKFKGHVCYGEDTIYRKWNGIQFKISVFAEIDLGIVSATVSVPIFKLPIKETVGEPKITWPCHKLEQLPVRSPDSYDDPELMWDSHVYRRITQSVVEQGDFFLSGNRKRYDQGNGDLVKNDIHKFLVEGETDGDFPFLPRKKTNEYRNFDENDDEDQEEEESSPHFTKKGDEVNKLLAIEDLIKSGMTRETLWPRVNGNDGDFTSPTPTDGSGPSGVWEEVGENDFPFSISPNWNENRGHMHWELHDLTAKSKFKWLEKKIVKKQVPTRGGGTRTVKKVKWIPKEDTATSDKQHDQRGKLRKNIRSFFQNAKDKIQSSDPEEHLLGLYLLGRGAHYLIDAGIPLQTVLVDEYQWENPDTVNLGKKDNRPDLNEKANELFEKNREYIIRKAIADHYGVNSYSEAQQGLDAYVQWVSKKLKPSPNKFLTYTELEAEQASKKSPGGVLSEMMQETNNQAPIKLSNWQNVATQMNGLMASFNLRNQLNLGGGNWKKTTRKRLQIIGKYLASIFEWAAPKYFDYGRNDADRAKLRPFGPMSSE